MNKPSEVLPRSIWFLSAGLMSVGAGQSLVFITVPPAARDLGLSELQIGLIFASSAIAWMLFSPIWGRLSDSIGRKKIVLIGLFGFALSLCLFSATINLGINGIISGVILLILLIISRMINGLLGSATRPASGGWIADITSSSQRSRAFARLDSGFSLGRLIGPGIASFLLLISYTFPFYLFALLAILIGITIFFIPEKISIKPMIKKKKTLSIIDAKVFPFVLVAGCFGICNASLVQISSFYYQDIIVPNSDDFIFFSSLGFMVTALGFLLGQLLIADKLGVSPGSLIRTGLLLVGCSLFLIFIARDVNLMYFALLFYGVGAGMIGPGIAGSFSLSVGKDKQGEASGLLSMVIPIGHIISPIITMPLYQLNNSAPFLLNSFMVVVVLFFVQFNKHHKWIRDKNYRIDELDLIDQPIREE